ncbi:MAG: PspC domain-containing protein [Flavobacteriales bacterium]|jgi:phage shock protein PspC (stress-responsive transcriptional regulator)|nr:PspC domain-containing protein [Flavobacteriales bacterium]MBK7941949.1 PspC domain-containing protein [Flavobacteriales bacterium]MBK8947749.1 PspC domain-containing protein [Flavobacteriales bacterium]MBK9700492.1 PspC domain-containing protein [Flavobacteriales bacterium]
MKKTLTANISGTVFHIEEDAYDKLNRYLGTIRARFSGSEGRDEIMADIEARIAELFQERLQGRQVVGIADVDHVIAVMGQPEDYADGEAGGGGAIPPPPTDGRRRLYRDPEDSWVGGVFGGLAAYLGTDPLWMRIAFILLVIFGVGSPLLIYIILWILIPQASSAAERLMMQGEPVTVDNLKRSFEEGAERVKQGAERVAREADELGRRWSNGPARAYGRQARQGVGEFARGAAGVAAKIVGVFTLVLGAILTLALVGALIGGGTITLDHFGGLEGTGLFDLSAVVFDSAAHAFWGVLCAVLLLLIPAIGLFIGGLRLLTGLRAPQWLGWTLSTAWFVALMVVLVVGLRLGNDLKRDQKLREELSIAQPAGQTLFLGVHDMRGLGKDWRVAYDDGRVDWDMEGLMTTADSIHGAWANLDVVPSPDSLFHLMVERRANGRTEKMALARASHTGFTHAQRDSLLLLSPWVDMPREDKLRAQRVRFEVQVPVGRAVHFQSGIGFMLDDVDNVTNTWDDEMVGRTWTMTSGGLSSSVTPEQVPDDLPPPALPATPPAAAPATTPEPTAAPSGTSDLRTYSAPDLLTAVFRRT